MEANDFLGLGDERESRAALSLDKDVSELPTWLGVVDSEDSKSCNTHIVLVLKSSHEGSLERPHNSKVQGNLSGGLGKV